MGREIRRVVPNWEHPKQECRHRPICDGGYCYQPMLDSSFEEAAKEWKDRFLEWEAGKRPSYYDAADHEKNMEYWEEDGMPPQRKFYRPNWKEEERTWFQVYQTVSEGSPITPPFATKEEIVEYLVKHGDFWDQIYGRGGWSREAAESFVKNEWAPSMMVFNEPGNFQIKTPRDGAMSDE